MLKDYVDIIRAVQTYFWPAPPILDCHMAAKDSTLVKAERQRTI